MRKMLLRAAVALLAVCGLVVGAGVSPAAAADNVGVSYECTSAGTTFHIYTHWNATGGSTSKFDYWEISANDPSIDVLQTILHSSGWGPTADINMSHSGPNYVGYSGGLYHWHHDYGSSDVDDVIQVSMAVTPDDVHACGRTFNEPDVG